MAKEAEGKQKQTRPDQLIVEFEERLKKPMLPDAAKAVEKAQRKFPVILKNFGWAILLIFLVMYAAIGLNGLLIFLGGILFLVTLQAALLFRYIVNENFRAKVQREANDREASEEEFLVIEKDHDPSKPEEETKEKKNSVLLENKVN